ncbi:hypothetical protein [Laspinema palackyanum]|uniref:hypothetical protein n=1 Tax=Laspinema palackyanum TaxID=3231601 RepID=UPI00345CE2A6|nr:hypothetical protein [Laspinema sp. D2c]
MTVSSSFYPTVAIAPPGQIRDRTVHRYKGRSKSSSLTQHLRSPLTSLFYTVRGEYNEEKVTESQSRSIIALKQGKSLLFI